MTELSAFSKPKRILVKLLFTIVKERFFKELSALLEVGIPLREALSNMREASVRYQSALCENWAKICVLDDCLYRLSHGASALHELLAGYVSDRDTLLLTGAKSNTGKAIESILYLQQTFSSLKGEVIKFSLAPIMAIVLMVGSIYACVDYIFPNLLGTFELHDLPTETQLLYNFSHAFVNHIALITGVFALMMLGIFLSLSHLTGKLRAPLDALVPFSIYKRLVAITYLLTLSELIATGKPFDESLSIIRASSSRYLRFFIGLTQLDRACGGSMGDSLVLCGLFPRHMNSTLSIFQKTKRFEKGLHYLAHKGLAQEIKRLRVLFLVFASIAICIGVSFALWLFMAIGDIGMSM